MQILLNRYRTYCLLVICMMFARSLNAQPYLNSPVGQYYRNGFLWNPAYAGSKDHPSIYALLNNSWLGFEGAPRLTMVTGDFSFGKNSGLGARFISDKSGLLNRTLFTMDYSFTMQLNGGKRLRLGISAGASKERIQNNSAAYDPLIYSFNAKDMRVDGSLGAVYEDQNFSLSGVLYNLRSSLQKNSDQTTGVPTANMMASWRFIIISNDSTSLKPLISYKTFSAGTGLLTLGVQLERNRLFNTSFLWQNSGTLTGSVGLRLAKIGEINFSYANNRRYGYELYEVGLGIGLQ